MEKKSNPGLIKFFKLADCTVIMVNRLLFVSSPSPEVATIVVHQRKYYQTSLLKLRKKFTTLQWSMFLSRIPAKRKTKVSHENICEIYEKEKKQVA